MLLRRFRSRGPDEFIIVGIERMGFCYSSLLTTFWHYTVSNKRVMSARWVLRKFVEVLYVGRRRKHDANSVVLSVFAFWWFSCLVVIRFHFNSRRFSTARRQRYTYKHSKLLVILGFGTFRECKKMKISMGDLCCKAHWLFHLLIYISP